ncbi:MAG: phosphate ABC transporter substrate-binding protein PstS family protein [Lactobacillales bacterium]|jgi:phosphate transport system substrate-binding protein|nr:phosphate ABC transporter substrate-binding protein PstS family protein [Lactobacillales bacterium]
MRGLMKLKIIFVLFAVLSVFCLSSCTKIDKGESITAVGSSALQPFAETAAESFSNNHLRKFINVQGGGSGTGLSQVLSGAVQIGNSDMFAEEKSGINASKLVDHKICVVGIAPVVNKYIKIKNVTSAQLEDIFLGKILNWQEIAGRNLPIVLINRAAGSGTRLTFEKCILEGKESKIAQEQDSSGMVRQIVQDTPGAISYLAFSYIPEDMVKLSIDGIKPTAENVAQGRWPIWSYEHMYTKGQPKPKSLTKQYLDYVTSYEVQNTLVKKLGYIPMTAMKIERNADGKIMKK